MHGNRLHGIYFTVNAKNELFSGASSRIHLRCAQVGRLGLQRSFSSLFSPPYTPRYNGACEAGIGGLKARTHHLAAVDGRPGRWSCEDVEAARRMADEEHYPRRLRGLTAAEAWSARQSPVTNKKFASSVDIC